MIDNKTGRSTFNNTQSENKG